MATKNHLKRERALEDDDSILSSPVKDDLPADGGSTSNFRNVSACNRCRNRKNRCDQKLPRCTGCEKANVKCVGFDPVSKRTIPRSYVYYLETRVLKLEALLRTNDIPFEPPEEDFSIDENIKPGKNVPFPIHDGGESNASTATARPLNDSATLDPSLDAGDEHEKLNRLVSDVGMVSVQGTSESRYLGSTSGISFARVVFAAVKSSVSHTPSERGGPKSIKQLPGEATGASGASMRDSFFGLHTKPTIKPAPFPERPLGLKLVQLYFEHANPQIPVLHRGEFMALLDRVYTTDSKRRTARELYLLNIVFAIGSSIIMDSSSGSTQSGAQDDSDMDVDLPSKKRPKISNRQHQPEEYHSSAVVHLESFLGSSPAGEGSGGGLEELQAVLLLAALALFRPVAPGLWYIVGVAVRLAVDLGLHSEDIDVKLDTQAMYAESEDAKSLGRKQWTRDLRRRLWWCVYAFDRLVSTCVGRPFGITDQVITTEFPSMLEDKYITTRGFTRPPCEEETPSYKLVARHYLRLRLLHSEILQVLQHRQAEAARQLGANSGNNFIHKDLTSVFLHKFDTFREWRSDIDRRLLEWKESVPKQYETGVAFTPLFLELNYWQSLITLYRQSLAVPEPLAGEISPSTGGDVHSPGTLNYEAKEDEEMVFMKVAQAGQMVLKTYRQLHRLKLVNYTFLATHHLFMSGISFLYAIWHSPLVRSRLTMDDVDFTVLVATSVLGDLVPKCPPAEACRDAFVRMSKATIAMVEKTTGFGTASTLSSQPLYSGSPQNEYFDRFPQSSEPRERPTKRKMTMPKFDMNLKDLFSDEEIANRPLMVQPELDDFAKAARQPDARPLGNGSSGRNFALSAPQHRRTDSSSSQSFAQPVNDTFTSPSPSTSNLAFNISNQQPYAPFASTISQAQPEFAFDDMSFLDSFPVADPTGQQVWQGSWGSGAGTNEIDLSFGTGGTGGWDTGWDPNSVDMLGGFFFGGDGNGF